ncbi:hypothetical protein HGRIS_006221 [Hohenbuehelia grisea]|uniref:Acetyl-CoA synthetase-like protein n=1 Tax=Hohenbuehelia grisea TaxID=104357 RepID=A0ABR3K0E1_9AGAR
MPGLISPNQQCLPLTKIPSFPVLVPQAIDYRAHQAPERVIISYPIPGTAKFVDVTWAEFAHAVDKAAWVYDAQLGARRSSSQPVKAVGILARSDAAYMVTVYALHKCGITPLLISTRNSHAAIVNLLKLTKAVALITDSYHLDEAKASVAEVDSIPIFDLAPLPGPITEKKKPFMFNLDYADECDNPGIILHTSGSTGLPKPVAWSTRFFWHQTYYPAEYVAKYDGSSFLSTLPMFHGSGFSLIRASLLWLGWKVIFPDPSRPVTAAAILDLCRNPAVAPDIVAGAPSVIEEIPSLPSGVDTMKGRKSWFFVGAPVPPHFGDFLVKEGVHFTPNLGSTEIGQMSVLEPEGRTPEDWNYHEIRPDLDIILKPQGDDLFELIILAKDGWQPGVVNFEADGAKGYATSDLYQRHPKHPRLFKHCGRADDVIVLANGEKTLSRAIEVPIEADLRVRNAIVFGTGRTQNGVMVVPAQGHEFDPADTAKLAEFRDAIWSSVENANSTSPAHSQIWKEMLLVTSPSKELPRTDKGSVKRKLAIALYEEEINALYASVDEEASAKLPPLPEDLAVASLVPYFRTLVGEAMKKPMGLTDEVFEHGMDSLKAIFVRNSLLSALKRDERTREAAEKVPQNFVFSNTTVEAMAAALGHLLETGHLVETGQETPEQHAQMINDMVAKYTNSFPEHVAKGAAVSTSSGEVAILTGSTGSLGTYLLNSLLERPDVVKIFAFNRKGSSPALDRQKRSYAERELSVSGLEDAVDRKRLEFHDVELHKPNFGLTDDVYQDILGSTTVVIHNAWALNFNWTLATFEPVHIKGVRNLVDFALASPRATPPRISFTSSISTAGAYTTGLVPEAPLSDPAVCMPHGYARAKFVGERILAEAAEKTGVKTVSFRIGQIAGDSVRGTWNATDSVPALLKGCQELGAIPTDWIPVASWMPADYVAQTIVDVCMDVERGAGTFHVSHPAPAPWADVVLPIVAKNLATPEHPELERITMREWVQRLKDCGQSPEVNPAVKLIAFFENAMNGRGVRCRLDLEKTKEVSAALKAVPPVDEDAVERYLGYWKRTQFIR